MGMGSCGGPTGVGPLPLPPPPPPFPRMLLLRKLSIVPPPKSVPALVLSVIVTSAIRVTDALGPANTPKLLCENTELTRFDTVVPPACWLTCTPDWPFPENSECLTVLFDPPPKNAPAAVLPMDRTLSKKPVTVLTKPTSVPMTIPLPELFFTVVSTTNNLSFKPVRVSLIALPEPARNPKITQ